MHVLAARATNRCWASVTLHSTRPIVRPSLTIQASAISLPVQNGLRKLIFSSSVVKVSPSSSVLAQLNCRVNRFEFRSGIVDPHLPVNATLGGVDIVRPGFCFLTQTGDISEAAVC